MKEIEDSDHQLFSQESPLSSVPSYHPRTSAAGCASAVKSLSHLPGQNTRISNQLACSGWKGESNPSRLWPSSSGHRWLWQPLGKSRQERVALTQVTRLLSWWMMPTASSEQQTSSLQPLPSIPLSTCCAFVKRNEITVPRLWEMLTRNRWHSSIASSLCSESITVQSANACFRVFLITWEVLKGK